MGGDRAVGARWRGWHIAGWIGYAPGVSRICLPQGQLRKLHGMRLKMRDDQGFALYAYNPAQQ
jgi:hypothetical protein